MFRPCIEQIGFNDKWMMVIGIPLIAIIIPPLFNEITYSEYPSLFHQAFPEALLFVCVFWFFNRALFIILRKKYDISQSLQRVLIHFLILLFTTPILAHLCKFIINSFYKFSSINQLCHHDPNTSTVTTIFICVAVLAIYEAIYFFIKYRESIVEKEQLQTAHIQVQLDNLRNQINPHFLFNSLNTLMNLIPVDPDRAINYLSKLSQFYRYTVSIKDETTVPILTEIENAKIYAALLKERFGCGLTIDFMNINGESSHLLPMSLQLTIENAIKHNIVSIKSPLKIEISLNEDKTYIVICNNVQKKITPDISTGTGIKNIRERYKYFTKSEIIVNEYPDKFCIALPLISIHI